MKLKYLLILKFNVIKLYIYDVIIYLRRNVSLTTVTADKTKVTVINRAWRKIIISAIALGPNGVAIPSTKILQNAVTNCQLSIGWEPAQTQPILSEYNCKPQ